MQKLCFSLLVSLTFLLPVAAKPLYEYKQSRDVTDAVWEAVQPYLLPSTHPIKSRLDKIFASEPHASETRLKNAGFARPYQRPHSRMVVSRHEELPGYLVKLFTEDQSRTDYTAMIHRIKGARSIKKSIEKYGFQKFFK